MYCAGIGYHKRYSIVSIQNAQGQIVQEQRVDHPFPELFGGQNGRTPDPFGRTSMQQDGAAQS
ncbi:MAG: hypothetical protein ABFE13_05140 [Phycisphaerales bacterium]